MKIAIVGCGTAGPAAAILLKRQGHDITLFERATECRAVGAGFLLQPSGMGVLREIGILDDILTYAAKVDCLHVLDENDKTLLRLEYRELGEDLFGAGLHRPVLLHYLIREMTASGVDLCWDSEIKRLQRDGEQWQLHLNNGAIAAGFDFIILADGARSKLRQHIGYGGKDRGYPWGAHWFIGKNQGVFPENELYQIVNGTRKLGGFLATGRELDGDEPLVSLFWSVRLDEDAAWRARPLEEWKRQILDLCPKAKNLLDQIHHWDQILTAAYGDVRMRRWHDDRIVVLGDAGHAMSPQLGQGVNLALADASCLAHCIANHSLPKALYLYQRRRRLPLGYYQLATRWLTPWFQSDHEWLTPLRRMLFAIACFVPLSRRMMTRSMAGLIAHRHYFSPETSLEEFSESKPESSESIQ
jgi:2-polyprenyl-6-methoxyphenol hydroxylase-like FAD-dependent oxidoreductase